MHLSKLYCCQNWGSSTVHISSPFGRVGKKERTKKESSEEQLLSSIPKSKKELFPKLKENVCYWNVSRKRIIYSPAFSSVKCYPSYKCQTAIRAARECVLQIKKHSMNCWLFLIKKHPEEGWTVLSQEEASISGVIFIVIREKILLAMNMWLLDSCLLVEERGNLSSLTFLSFTPHTGTYFPFQFHLPVIFSLKRVIFKVKKNHHHHFSGTRAHIYVSECSISHTYPYTCTHTHTDRHTHTLSNPQTSPVKFWNCD